MKTVVISGASGALGTACCAHFLSAHWQVVALVRGSKGQAFQHDAYKELVCELSSISSLSSVFQNLERVDAVVHLAGGIRAGSLLEEASLEEFDEMMSSNTRTTFALLNTSIPYLDRDAGCFVAVGAMSALYPAAKRAAYSASKAAVISLIKSAAAESRGRSYRAHVIVPGILKTAANLEWATHGEESGWIGLEDCANCIESLCSDSMKATNGSVIEMFGGLNP